MQSYQRRALLSAALQLQPGRDPTRETVEAAIWAALGSIGDESRVSLLLAVIDAYSDARSRRAAASWASSTGGTMPPLGADLAQSAAVRRSLDALASFRSPAMAPAMTPAMTPAMAPAMTPPTPLPVRQPSLMSVVSETKREPVRDDLADDSFDAVWKELRNVLAIDDQSAGRPLTSSIPAAHGKDGVPLYSCSTDGCTDLKPETEFYKSKSSKRGFDYTCKSCKNKKNKAWRDKKRELEEREEQGKTKPNADSSAPHHAAAAS